MRRLIAWRATASQKPCSPGVLARLVVRPSRGSLALLLAFATLWGCRNQSPPGTDPFFGRTAVPPPPTGALTVRPCDPYYRAAPAANAPLAPIPQVQQPGVSLPPPAATSPSRYDPPGGTFNYRGAAASQSGASGAESAVAQATADTSPSRIKIVEPKDSSPTPVAIADTRAAATATTDAKGLTWTSAGAASEATPTAASAPSAALAGPLSGRPRVVRALQPRPSASAGSPGSISSPMAGWPAATDRPSAGSNPAKSVEIMQLPPAGSSTSSGDEKPGSAAGVFRVVSDTPTSSDSGGVVAADYVATDPPQRSGNPQESRISGAAAPADGSLRR